MVPKFTGTKCSRLLKSVRLAKAALAPLALTQISLIKHNLDTSDRGLSMLQGGLY